jgi:hypothetical protein
MYIERNTIAHLGIARNNGYRSRTRLINCLLVALCMLLWLGLGTQLIVLHVLHWLCSKQQAC